MSELTKRAIFVTDGPTLYIEKLRFLNKFCFHSEEQMFQFFHKNIIKYNIICLIMNTLFIYKSK